MQNVDKKRRMIDYSDNGNYRYKQYSFRGTEITAEVTIQNCSPVRHETNYFAFTINTHRQNLTIQ